MNAEVVVVGLVSASPFVALVAVRGHRSTTRHVMHTHANSEIDLRSRPASSTDSRRKPFVALGRQVRRLIGYPKHAQRDRQIGLAVSLVPVGVAVSPLLGVLVGAGLASWPLLVARRQTRGQEEVVLRELPEIVDLYSVALNSGHNIATASREVSTRGHGVVASALADMVDRSVRGQPLDVALDALHDELGSRVRPLTSVLVAGLRYGAPVSDSLVRVAVDLRLERRRHAENAARRLPVVMLFPLVLCVLPAFGLLTVVPVLVQSLQSLSL